MATIEQIASFLSNKLINAGVEIERMIVFGSRARGEECPESDFDFAVISRTFEGKDLYERGKLTAMPVAETIRQFDVPIDLIELTSSELAGQKRLVCSYVSQGRDVHINYPSASP